MLISHKKAPSDLGPFCISSLSLFVGHRKGDRRVLQHAEMIWFLAMPPTSLIVLMLVGLAIARKRRRIGGTLLLVGLILLYALSIEPMANMLLKPLESAAPPLQQLPARADAVVVPGKGGVRPEWR